MNAWELLRGFIDRSDRVLALLDGFMPECAWIDNPETRTYLHSTISTNRQHVPARSADASRRPARRKVMT